MIKRISKMHFFYFYRFLQSFKVFAEMKSVIGSGSISVKYRGKSFCSIFSILASKRRGSVGSLRSFFCRTAKHDLISKYKERFYGEKNAEKCL